MAREDNSSIENTSNELAGLIFLNLNYLTVIRRFTRSYGFTPHAFGGYRNGQEHGKNDQEAQRDEIYFFIFKFPWFDVKNPQQAANYQAQHIVRLIYRQ